MSRPSWRIGSGALACLLWTCFIGYPVLQYHATSYRLNFGDHLHSTILFIISEFLVFWLFARPVPSPIEKPIVAEIVPEEELLTPFRQDEP